MAARPGAQSSFAALPVGAKVFVLFLLLTVVGGGYVVGFHMSMEEELESAKRQEEVLRNDLKEAERRQQEAMRLREEVAGREALEKQILRVLPETAEIPAFLDDLNRLAELSGLKVSSVTPTAGSQEEYFTRVPVTLRMVGKYHQLAKFFYNVSRLERAINMENISLQEPIVQGEDVLLAVSVLATTFRRNPETQ
ncbi:MAG: type 4a pilus biogenesis protein PilO [Myxococcales bacterium]|nr:type 4a pilus biogenesis protein PilO [Myxococcales bacterium]MDD9972295.1 type 4a pilus biogenesis protein PilO [Myxococcales bacterium]